MNWLVVVVFATMAGDVYIFTDPVFDTQEECRQTLVDKTKVKGYINKLATEYGTLLPILAVDCLEEQQIKEILESKKDKI